MKSEKSTFRGIARNVNGLRFRLERIDNEGNVIDYVATSAMGSLTGDLVDGDEIEVVGKINKEGLLIANKILNLKTRAYIMKSGLINKGFVIFLLPFIFAIIIGLISGSPEGFVGGFIFGCFLAVFIFIIFMVVTVFRS
jgi:hypothetical protein